MKLRQTIFNPSRRIRVGLAGAVLFSAMFSHAGCFLNAKVEPFYSQVVVPRSQEFRWSDGGLPQTFDPAFAAAPPDTDLVRAIFEGLTDYDARTLTPIPAGATRWEPSNGGRVWTFYLRPDAHWSNGEPVTADDFVRSWQRTLKIGDLAPHTELLENIEGGAREAARPGEAELSGLTTAKNKTTPPLPAAIKRDIESSRSFGAEALSKLVLRVHLRRPDLNFPALVAHPVFRPVKIADETDTGKLGSSGLVSNGPFSLLQNESERILLERANNYWDKDQVTLQRVEFVGQKNVESALAAYRDGEVDAVTNAAFEPLAIKILKPYEDFRHTTYGALTYYTFNKRREPFDDVRVREALALAIDRDRISADDMGGATEPAKRFLPEAVGQLPKPVVGKSELLEEDLVRARKLLAEAGFPDGRDFPRIQLLINRNEQQRTVAQAVAAMWRRELKIEADIIVKNWDEYEAAIRAGEFDVVRRGVVIQTTDELTNMRMILRGTPPVGEAIEQAAKPGASAEANPARGSLAGAGMPPQEETEAQALNALSAMPIYFASSYALVKPYVVGFDSNVLDAPSLKTVRINTNWKPAEPVAARWAK